jgi:hypothetical protein
MRYSAIRIFNEGGFILGQHYRHDAIDNLNVADNAGRLRGFFNKNKYVVVTSSEDTDFTYMLFREDHYMFNLPVFILSVLSRRIYDGRRSYTINGLLDGIIKELLTNFNNNTI